MTCYLIAHSIIDENSGASGGYSGDQTGYELTAQPFFESSWTHLYRAKDAEKAEQIADFMEKAVANGYIGYDNSQRNTLFQAIYPDFKVDRLTTPVESDCSSLVYCAVYSAFRLPYKAREEEKHIAPLVKGFEEYLMLGTLAGNFERWVYASHTSNFITSSDKLVRGDILVKDGHIAVWI